MLARSACNLPSNKLARLGQLVTIGQLVTLGQLGNHVTLRSKLVTLGQHAMLGKHTIFEAVIGRLVGYCIYGARKAITIEGVWHFNKNDSYGQEGLAFIMVD